MPAKTVLLSQTYQGHNKPFSGVTLREPRWPDLMELGEPTIVTRYPDGSQVTSVLDVVLADYIKRCVVEPEDYAVLTELSLRDTRAVRGAMLDFFSEPPDSANASSDSSSNTAGDPPTSTD